MMYVISITSIIVKRKFFILMGARTNKELGKMTFEGVSFLSKLGTALFFSKEKVAENR